LSNGKHLSAPPPSELNHWRRFAGIGHVARLRCGGTFSNHRSKTPDFLDQFNDDSGHQGVSLQRPLLDAGQPILGQAVCVGHITNICSYVDLCQEAEWWS
jgi:hypothetical protein